MEDPEETSRQKVKRKKAPLEDLKTIQADVASFAASLGLTAAGGVGSFSTGFDDSDFRKTGRLRKDGPANEEKVEEKSNLHSGKERKKKKKNASTEDISGASTRKVADSRKNSKTDESASLGNEKGTAKGKTTLTSEIKTELAKKGSKKVPPAEPVKSRIHEVLNMAIAGESTLTKKRKASWNDDGGAEQESGQLKRSFVRPGETGEPNSIQVLRVEAQQLMDKAAQDYERSRYRDRDAQWLMTARRSGTSADKVAAMTVILQENPKANVRTLDALIGMLTSKAGKRHAATGIDALKELFMFNLLPDRKLKYFSQQPIEILPDTKERASKLVEWYWEDCLKERYEKFVLALEEATKDSLFFLKEKALKTVYELLKSKPEQERRLLATLVNKLGDPDRKMASNSSFLLSNLLTAHPNMKKVVVDEVEAFVFRSHVGLRARYYAAIFLNQIVLSNKGDGPALAKHLVDLYFSLFKAVTSVVDEEDLGKKNKGVAGRKKGVEKVKQKEHSADFTMEIDSRLLSALLTGVNRALPYILAEDLDVVMQDNSVLFRLVHSTNFNVAVQALMLLHQLLTKNQAVSDRFYRALYAVLLSKGLVQSSKTDLFLGLVFKALKSDVDSRRVSAFAKRLTQVAMHQPPQFACGTLMILSEILKSRPTLWSLVLQPEDNDEEDEHFKDVEDIPNDKIIVDRKSLKDLTDRQNGQNVWPKKGSYDPRHRDPLYCNAHRSCWWELLVLAGHVHPSVAAMARTLLTGANVIYNGDPLRDLALGAFLDKFSEKKAKSQKSKESSAWHGSSLPLPSKMAEYLPNRPVGEEFSLLAEDQVAPEDVVFHKFYVAKSSKKSLKKKKRGHEDDDDVTGEILAADVLDGDDSDDDEVDTILEQDADLEMDGGEDSVEEDSADEDIAIDEEDDELGSEVEEFDNSEDDEADVLLEAGLAMSSDDDDDDDDDEAGERKTLLSSKRKSKDGKPVLKSSSGSSKRGSKNQSSGTSKGDGEGISLGTKKRKKKSSPSGEDLILETSATKRKGKKKSYLSSEGAILEMSANKRKGSRVEGKGSLAIKGSRGKKASVFREANSDSEDF